jgi:hypothetical protein
MRLGKNSIMRIFIMWHVNPLLSNDSVNNATRFCTHTAFNLPYVYDCITKLCRRQAEVIQNRENERVRGIGQGEARHRKYKRLKLGGGQAYDRSGD